MRCRLAIFDFDGTLADSFPWFLRNVNHAADRYRFRRVAPDQVEALRGMDARAIMAHLRLPLWKTPAVARHLRRRMTRELDQIPLFAGVDGMLRALRAEGISVAVVTSNSAENVRRVLGAELAAAVAHFECGVSVFGKHRRLRRTLRRCGVAPEEAVLVGDEVRDAEAARAAGIPFAAVAWGYTRPEALLRCAPRAVFATPEDIRAWLASSPRENTGAPPGAAHV